MSSGNSNFGNYRSLLRKLLDGWNLSGVTTIQDGQPLTVQDTRGGSIYCGSCQASFSNVHSTAEMANSATYPRPVGWRRGNHAQFANPVSTDISRPNFGWITGASVNPRLIQFALKTALSKSVLVAVEMEPVRLFRSPNH